MKRKIFAPVAVGIVLLLLSCVFVSAGGAERFADVPSGAWFEGYVSDVYEAGIMEGKPGGIFDPEGIVSRAEYVTAMARITGEDVKGYSDAISRFPDADTEAWYADYMGWAVSIGLVNGRDGGLLAPTSPVSRAEMAALTDRLLAYLDVNVPADIYAEDEFSDVESDAWYFDSLELMRKTTIINGDGTGRFNPDDTAQRHSMAAVISRLLVEKAEAAGYKVGLPVITIDTETGRDVESKEEYIRASFTLKDADGRDISVESFRIRGRGNATWKMEKKSYRLKFDDNICLMSESSGGDTKNKDWTLLANHCDKSLIRNHVAQSLGRELDGIEWAPYTELVEVYLNGEYRGVYMLSEQVEVGDQRVDIEDGEADDIGFLFELDGYAEGEYNVDFFTVQGTKYTVKSDVKDADQVIAMKVHLETLLNIAREGDKAKVEAAFDLDSVVDIYILQEFMRNLDAGWSSFFMYCYEPHGKLYFGPPWDFDLSTGNTYNSHEPKGLYVGQQTYSDGSYVGSTTNQWFAAFLSHEWFREMVRDRYNEKSDDMMNVVNRCCKEAYVNMEYLDRNFEKWDIMHELINQEPIPVLRLNSCSENVEYLGAWVLERHTWLLEFYNSEKFLKEFETGEIPEPGVTEVLDADVWTVADWFEGDKLTQIYMDILYSSVETEDGRMFARVGLTETLTPDNVANVLLVKFLGAERNRYTFTFDEEEFAAMKAQFKGLGIGQGIIWEATFTVKDKITGEESLPATYTFVIVKEYKLEY